MLYEELRKQLAEARRLMVLSYGKPEHATYKQLCRVIENDIKKALSPSKESA